MPKLRRLALALGLISSIIAFAAEPQRYELALGTDFNVLKVTDGINVVYRTCPDSIGYAVFSTTPDLASMIAFDVKKTKLSVRLNLGSDADYVPAGLPTVTVYSSALVKAENSGDSLLKIASPITAEKFQAKIIGNGSLVCHEVTAPRIKASITTGHGQIVISGSCDKASLSAIGGAGVIQADGLKCVDASCRVVGTGTIGVDCTGKLSVYGAGSGKVYYTVTPAVVKNSSVGISVSPIR